MSRHIPARFHAAAVLDADAVGVYRVLLQVKHDLPGATPEQVAWLAGMVDAARRERERTSQALYAAIGEAPP
jgi:hypothetical protein